MSIQVITCPEILTDTVAHSTFLAGGITGCPDWQKEFISLCENYKPVIKLRNILVNPRRNNFDVSNLNMSIEQIDWEYSHLRKCDILLFWFPKETLCPISLLELGAAMEREVTLIVGCHPEYQRRFDVEYQLKISRPTIKMAQSLSQLVTQLLGSQK